MNMSMAKTSMFSSPNYEYKKHSDQMNKTCYVNENSSYHQLNQNALNYSANQSNLMQQQINSDFNSNSTINNNGANQNSSDMRQYLKN